MHSKKMTSSGEESRSWDLGWLNDTNSNDPHVHDRSSMESSVSTSKNNKNKTSKDEFPCGENFMIDSREEHGYDEGVERNEAEEISWDNSQFHGKGLDYYLLKTLSCWKLVTSRSQWKKKKCWLTLLVVCLLLVTILAVTIVTVPLYNTNTNHNHHHHHTNNSSNNDGNDNQSSRMSADTEGGAGGLDAGEPSKSPTTIPLEWLTSTSPSISPSHSLTSAPSWGKKSFAIFVGADHTCAIIEPANKLYCWGLNDDGQVGDGTDTDQLSPVHIPLDFEKQVSHLSLGSHHTCAVLHDGSIQCWGDNEYGELGDNTTDNKKYPSTVQFQDNTQSFATHVAAGYYHSCAILHKDRQLMCWGRGLFGRLGDGKELNRNTPTHIPIGPVQTVTLGHKHSCAILLTNSSLFCWGFNALGQLGDGTYNSRLTPTHIPLGPNRHAIQVALGRKHTCALLDDNTVKCWGYNNAGQLGDGTQQDRNIPTLTKLNLQSSTSTSNQNRKVLQLEVGGWHSCLLLDDGTLMCWGDNDHGQIGDGTIFNRLQPTVVNVGINRKVIHISLGSHHTCAAIDDGTLLCWGHNKFGQLGYGTTEQNEHAIHAPVIFSDTNIFHQ